MLLAKRIKLIRKSKGLTQEQMAFKLKISQPAYAQFESEKSNCTFDTISKIAQVFKCSVPFITDVKSTFVHELEWETEFANKILLKHKTQKSKKKN
jgi:transcriptional regulator with XRE-family HTH domain